MCIILSCCFIGHKDCTGAIRTNLLKTIESLIKEKNVTKFYVGTQGSFDRLVYDVLCDLESIYKIEINVVLAYLNDNCEEKYYDITKSVYPDELTKIPLRFAIRKRNSYMIDKSDYVICYMNDTFSNTFTNVKEAVKKKKQIINLGEYNNIYSL